MAGIMELKNIYAGYRPGRDVIKDISFSVAAGEFLGVIGPNGSGKSTLLKVMSRVLGRRTGEISFDGRSLKSFKPKEFSRRAAFVGRDNLINFSFTVEDIALLGRTPHLGRLQSESQHDLAIARRALQFTDTFAFKDQAIDSLSEGERQRVLVAKALAQEPELLFLDEPTSHLDIGHQIQMLDLFRRLNRQKKMTMIMVIHDLNLAAEYCDRLLLLDSGRIHCQGAPAKVLSYANIEAVYKTVVVVKDNPVTHKPYVMLVPGELCRQE